MYSRLYRNQNRPAGYRRTADGGAGLELDRAKRWPSVVVILSLVVIVIGGNLPNPLYELYRRSFSFSVTSVTAIFATYVIGVLIALLFGGRLSDMYGRRPTLLAALALSVLGSLAFGGANDAILLFAGRVLQGLAIGLVSATAPAALIELHPTEGVRMPAIAVVASTNIAVGLGSMFAALSAEYLPAPERLVFILHVCAVVGLAPAVLRIPETVSYGDRASHWTLWRSPLAAPHGYISVFLATSIAGFCALAAVALFNALTPSFLGGVLRIDGYLGAGLVVLVLSVSAAIVQIAVLRWSARGSMLSGLAALTLGLAFTIVALTSRSLLLFAFCAVIVGGGLGATFQGALAVLNQVIDGDRRGAINASFFFLAYCGMALPVFGVGVAAVHVGLVSATAGFVVVIAILAAAAAVTIRIPHMHGKPERRSMLP